MRPGCPVVFGSFLSQHRHAVGLARLRHARVGDRPALHRPDRAALRAALALAAAGSTLEPDGRRPGRLRGDDDDAADVPRRHQLRDALGRLARVRPRRRATRSSSSTSRSCAMLEQEFTPLEIDEASLAFDAHAEVGAGRPLPRRRAHARALPRLLLPAAALLDRELRALEPARRATTPPSGPARSGAATLEQYEQPPLDDGHPRRARGVRRAPAGRARRLIASLPPRSPPRA